MTRLIPATLCFLISLLATRAVGQSSAQSSQDASIIPNSSNQEKQERSPVETIFDAIQRGITTSRITEFSAYFAPQVNINVRGHDRTYYSANQTLYLLKNFFEQRRAASFKFSTVKEDDATAFATGAGVFVMRGRRETLQVYVGVTRNERRWVISQFNVY